MEILEKEVVGVLPDPFPSRMTLRRTTSGRLYILRTFLLMGKRCERAFVSGGCCSGDLGSCRHYSPPPQLQGKNQYAFLLIFSSWRPLNVLTTSLTSAVVSCLSRMSWFRQQADEGFPRMSEDVLHLYESSPDDWTSLSPPRPPFMTSANRSWSSITLSASSDHTLSDRERSPTTSMSAPMPPPLAKSASNRKLRRSPSGGDYPPTSSSQDVQDGHNDLILMRRPPPSAFKLPFQSHPGNPDPLPPRSLSRASLESLPSSAQCSRDDDPLPPNTPGVPQTPVSDVYRNSVAGNLAHESQTNLPRTSSTPSFRSPFLSPASRPSSTIWSPPIQPLYGAGGTPNASTNQLGPVKKFKPPMPSTMLSEKIADRDKSWLRGQKGDRPRLSWWLTALMWFIGLCAGAVKIYFDYKSIRILDDSQLCPVFTDNFDSLNLNDWTPDIQLSGFGYVFASPSVTAPLA